VSQRPQWPFGVNYRSPQATGLLAWWPLHNQDGFGGGSSLAEMLHGNRYQGVLDTSAPAPTRGGDPVFGQVFERAAATALGAPVSNGADFASIPTTYDFGVSFWASSDALQISRTAIAWHGTDDFILYPFDTTASGVRVFWRDLGGAIISVATSYADRRMHHFCFASYASNDHRLFVDGVQIGSSTATGTAGPFTSITLLSWAEGAAQHFAGKICDLRLYNKAPTPAMVRDMWDPATRFELYDQPKRRIFRIPPYAGAIAAKSRVYQQSVPRASYY
jgi:hypothetical protein